MKKNIFRTLKNITYFIFRTDKFREKYIKNFAKGIKNKRILEIGSGKKHKGKDCYSIKKFFDNSNEFIQSDIIKEYGHKIVDVTKMKYKNEFDILICLTVLEHVYNFHKAIKNMYTSLKPNGIAIIAVPLLYPLHSEPEDYWRFTEHSIRKLLKDFTKIEIKYSGIRSFPFIYYIKTTK